MTPFQKINKANNIYTTTKSVSDTIDYCEKSGLSKLQMSSVARQIGVDKNLFWQTSQTDNLPSDYWMEFDKMIANPEDFGIYA